MHILYIHQYFATPRGSTGTRSYEFARRWASKGYKVTMLTTGAQLTNQDLAKAKGLFFKRFTIDGIDVLVLSIPYRQQMGIFKRCLSFLAFLLIASVVVVFMKKVDIIYATSTPLTIGIPAVVAKWFKRKKFIFEVRDQWPETPIEMGIIRNRILIKLLLWLERIIYRNSAAIVTISDAMAEEIKLMVGEGKPVYVIPNGTDLDFFRPDINGDAIRKQKHWDDKLVLVHAGAMGRINGLEFVIDVAEKLKDYQNILFVLIGEGSRKDTLKSMVKERDLKNVEICPSMPKKQLPAVFAAADIILATIGKFPIIEKHASLNKFYDGLGSGKPVLLNYSGWQREFLEEKSAGFGCTLCNIGEFVERVLYLNSHRKELLKVGQNARRIAEAKFDRNKLADHLETVLLEVIRA